MVRVGRFFFSLLDRTGVESSSTVEPPQRSCNEIAGLETSCRLPLLKCCAHCHPDITVRQSFANVEIDEDIFFMASFLVSRSHEILLEENRRFLGGTMVEVVSSFQFSGLTGASLRRA